MGRVWDILERCIVMPALGLLAALETLLFGDDDDGYWQ